MKILQVDTVGTEKGACVSMGALCLPKGGEERSGGRGMEGGGWRTNRGHMPMGGGAM